MTQATEEGGRVWRHCGSDLAVLQRLLTTLQSHTHCVAALRTHPHQVTYGLHHR